VHLLPARRARARAGLLCGALAAAALAAPVRPAAAQMQDALGKPLADSSLRLGTVSVRVVRGALTAPARKAAVSAQPVGGAQGQVQGQGQEQTRETDAQGRATFEGLSAGARYVITARVDGVEVRTETFTVPERGGLRFLLSSEPLAMAGDAAGGGPAAQGMPDPRMMSGIPRPQEGDPAGQLTVRAVQGKFSADSAGAPVGTTVHLVGLGADGRITGQRGQVGKDGRVVFRDLVTDGSVTYYASAIFARQGGRDRLGSQPINMPPGTGVRLMLAGHAVDASAPPVDDLVPQGGAAPPAGQVVVRLRGMLKDVGKVELVDATTGQVAATATPGESTPLPDEVMGRVDPPVAVAELAPGTIELRVVRARGQTPLADIEVTLTVAGEAEAGRALTDADGLARFTGLPRGQKITPAATVHGKRITGDALEVPAQGGQRITILTEWSGGNALDGRFQGLPGDESRLYVARLRAGDRVFHSTPLQLTADRGGLASILVWSDLAFGFHGFGELDDERMFFQMRMILFNVSAAPLRKSAGEVIIPLPIGFKGARLLDESMASKVGVDGERGLVWRGAVPPGQSEVMVEFNLPVQEGKVAVDLPLPFGAVQSQLMFMQMPGMSLVVPPGVQQQVRQADDGREFVMLGGIDIQPAQRLVMAVQGLPVKPLWKAQAPIVAGLVVLALLGWAVFGIFRRDPGGARHRAALERERERLLEELVVLERERQSGALAEGRYQRGKRNLMLQLERVYGELGTTPAGGEVRPAA
jgi:hypothetical protein